MSGKVRVGAVLSSAMAVWFTLVCAAGAHELRPAIADLEISSSEIVISIEVAVEPMLAGVDQSAFADTNDAPQAEVHDAFRAMPPSDLEAALRAAWPGLSEGFNVMSDGAAVTLSLGVIEVPETVDAEQPRDTRLVLTGALPEGTAPVTVGWAAKYGALVLRHGEAETGYSGFLTDGAASLPLPRDPGPEQSLWDTVLGYFFD